MSSATVKRPAGKAALKKALKEIDLDTPFELVVAKDGRGFALFTDWQPDVRWADVQRVCLDLGLIASSPRGVIWLYANGEWPTSPLYQKPEKKKGAAAAGRSKDHAEA